MLRIPFADKPCFGLLPEMAPLTENIDIIRQILCGDT